MKYNSWSNWASNIQFAVITPELYQSKSYYQLIWSITKCKNLSLEIFINVNKSHLTLELSESQEKYSETSIKRTPS